jgi:tRNA(adenine34) deaminase
MELYSDEYFMNEALKEAQQSLKKNEVPVGAIVVSQNKIIGRGHNLVEMLNDVTAHAEMQALTAASNSLGGKYLTDCTLYVTLEPCLMCAGALYWSQISRVVYGASDSKKGFSLLNKNVLHPKTKIENGILSEEASKLLKDFFISKRK